MNKVVFFVFDPSPRIERRIEDFVDAGIEVTVFGYKYDVINVDYCNSPKYKYNIIETIPHAVSYKRRIAGLGKIKKIINGFDRKNTLFYFFSLNVAAIAPFLHINYVYEESDMLFDRFGNKLFRKAVICFNKYVIKKSSLTVMTSEGFADFYYGDRRVDNIVFLPNKVHAKCLDLPKVAKKPFNLNKIRFGFAGNIRYQATLNIASIIARNYPQHEFHFYGNTESLTEDQKEILKESPNIVNHGLFKNPDDLPTIYSSIDFLVCTYDINGINPRYAEPNKLYEAIFFETPIIVSPESFLGKKVLNLGVGYAVDAYDESDIKNLVDSITEEDYIRLCNKLKEIPKKESISDNSFLINKIKDL